jgi:hypothetical protein
VFWSITLLDILPAVSYDLQIYSVRAFDAAIFDGVKGFNPQHCSFQTANWQIVVNPSDKILPEDIEDEVASLLPGIGFLTELNLEGRQTDEAKRRLRSAANAIAKATHGVVVDPQEDTIQTPAGVSRFSPPPKQESFSVIRLSWWFLNDAVLDRDKRESFISLLERQLPEAMPKRYGLYEPPQFQYAETGRKHFQQFLGEHLHDPIIWYPHRPVTGVWLHYPKPLGASRQGFRSNLLQIDVESAALNQPGWPENLRRLWRQMSALLRPIYGDVRKVGGYVRHGGSVWVDPNWKESFDQTTRSWFFRGIPLKLGQAVVLGDDYQKLWPDFVAKSQIEGALAFASTPDWSSEEDLSRHVGRTPKSLALRPGEGAGPSQQYPEIWPFGPVFDPPNT